MVTRFRLLALASTLLLVGCPASEEIDAIDDYQIIEIHKSNITIDCEGGLYNYGRVTELRLTTSRFSIPENVTIKNCTINGAIRIAGLGLNSSSEGVRISSYQEGHTQRVQAAAPRQILLDNLTINSTARIPLYVSPGTTGVTLSNSRLLGTSNSVAIYLEAETARNTIINNLINVRTGQSREVIALDGSAENLIHNNTIKRARYGGIYFYRNCGEAGTVRHQPPERNVVSSNSFDISQLSPSSYGIWLGSRNGNRDYCDTDKGYSFGSSIDDRDFANNNVIENNTFSSPHRNIRNNGYNNRIKQ
jgi:parallel beta-helix repeat protein